MIFTITRTISVQVAAWVGGVIGVSGTAGASRVGVSTAMAGNSIRDAGASPQGFMAVLVLPKNRLRPNQAALCESLLSPHSLRWAFDLGFPSCSSVVRGALKSCFLANFSL